MRSAGGARAGADRLRVRGGRSGGRRLRRPAGGGERAGVARVNAVAGMSEGELARHPGAVTSPMVGIAFLTPEPGIAAVRRLPARRWASGQTLLLIEAMKTFNQIKAHAGGDAVGDSGRRRAAPVEFGEVLAVID